MYKIKYKVMTIVMMLMISYSVTYGGIPSYGLKNSISSEKVFNCSGDILHIKKEIDVNNLAAKDLSIEVTDNGPQILIIHSHSHEIYKVDSLNSKGGSVMDIGHELKRELEANYNVSVLHLDTFDKEVNPVGAYERIEKSVKEILEKNSTIQVIIDIHRDGGPQSTAVLINDVLTSRISIINGLSIDEHIRTIGSLKQYPNAYIYDNLSFSIQMKLNSDKLYPNLIRGIYLNKFRYSLHMMPKSLLIDIGNNEDTLAQALNSVKPLSKILGDTLHLEEKK